MQIAFIFLIAILAFASRSKAVSIGSLVVAGALASICYSCADIVNYENNYKLAAAGAVGDVYFGFDALQRLFAESGIPFEDFRTLLLLISMLLIGISICSLTERPGIAVILYLIYSFGIDYVQLKNLLAFALAVMGITLLIKNQVGSKRAIGYTASLVFTAASAAVHYAYLIVLLLVILFQMLLLKNHYKKKIYIILIFAFIAIYTGAAGTLIGYISTVGGVREEGYYSAYTGMSMGLGFVIPLFSICGSIVALELLKEHNISESSIQYCIRRFVELSVLVLPLLLLQMTFLRLVRPFMLFAYIYFSSSCKESLLSLRLNSSIALFIAILAAFYGDIAVNYETTLGALMNTQLV